jgi:hypothetical protein
MGEAPRLSAIRRRVAAIDSARWMLSADGDATILDARGRDGSVVAIARFERLASPEEMEIAAAAPEDLRFLLGLVDRAIEAARRGQARHDPPTRGAPDHTTEAAMLCADPAFKRWLMDCHGLDSPATDERAAARLRSLLGVTSRKEINQTEDARARWTALRDEFRAWKRRAA